ncbi:MAG: hypothetical protein ACYDFQ_02355 [Vulcanimicrobiaceae bacterium]
MHMDVRDEQVERIVREFKPEVVSHHAAQYSVAIGSRAPNPPTASRRWSPSTVLLYRAVRCGADTGCRGLRLAQPQRRLGCATPMFG